MQWKFIRERVLAGEFLAGGWCNMVSPIAAEITARAGFDWVLFDQEHGFGDSETLLNQFHAVSQYPPSPMVRIPWRVLWIYKKVLDLGAMGIMTPYVETAEEAEFAAKAMRYPPLGNRGTAGTPRCAGFGDQFQDYYAQANQGLLNMVQIETARALDNVDDIAAVDGVDLLFVGPLDLAYSMGLQEQKFASPVYMEAFRRVAATAKKHGKAAGSIVADLKQAEMLRDMGYTMLAVSSETSVLSNAMAECQAGLAALK